MIVLASVFLLFVFIVALFIYFIRSNDVEDQENVQVTPEMLMNARNIARAIHEQEVQDTLNDLLIKAAKLIKKMSANGKTACVLTVKHKNSSVERAVIRKIVEWAEAKNISARGTYDNDGVFLDWSEEPEVSDLEPEN